MLKHCLFSFFIALFVGTSFGQIVDFPEEQAHFPCHEFGKRDSTGFLLSSKVLCGNEGLMHWIQENIRYPQISMDIGEQGKVYIKFVVEMDGSITNLQILRGVSKELDREAKRVIASMPPWVPGKVQGKIVRTAFPLPIVFKLT